MPDMTPPKAPANVDRTEATGDKTTTPEGRFTAMTEHLRHLLGLGGKETTVGTSSSTGKKQTVDEAVDEAVNGVPGHTADY